MSLHVDLGIDEIVRALDGMRSVSAPTTSSSHNRANSLQRAKRSPSPTVPVPPPRPGAVVPVIDGFCSATGENAKSVVRSSTRESTIRRHLSRSAVWSTNTARESSAQLVVGLDGTKLRDNKNLYGLVLDIGSDTPDFISSIAVATSHFKAGFRDLMHTSCADVSENYTDKIRRYRITVPYVPQQYLRVVLKPPVDPLGTVHLIRVLWFDVWRGPVVDAVSQPRHRERRRVSFLEDDEGEVFVDERTAFSAVGPSGPPKESEFESEGEIGDELVIQEEEEEVPRRGPQTKAPAPTPLRSIDPNVVAKPVQNKSNRHPSVNRFVADVQPPMNSEQVLSTQQQQELYPADEQDHVFFRDHDGDDVNDLDGSHIAFTHPEDLDFVVEAPNELPPLPLPAQPTRRNETETVVPPASRQHLSQVPLRRANVCEDEKKPSPLVTAQIDASVKSVSPTASVTSATDVPSSSSSLPQTEPSSMSSETFTRQARRVLLQKLMQTTQHRVTTHEDGNWKSAAATSAKTTDGDATGPYLENVVRTSIDRVIAATASFWDTLHGLLARTSGGILLCTCARPEDVPLLLATPHRVVVVVLERGQSFEKVAGAGTAGEMLCRTNDSCIIRSTTRRTLVVYDGGQRTPHSVVHEWCHERGLRSQVRVDSVVELRHYEFDDVFPAVLDLVNDVDDGGHLAYIANGLRGHPLQRYVEADPVAFRDSGISLSGMHLRGGLDDHGYLRVSVRRAVHCRVHTWQRSPEMDPRNAIRVTLVHDEPHNDAAFEGVVLGPAHSGIGTVLRNAAQCQWKVVATVQSVVGVIGDDVMDAVYTWRDVYPSHVIIFYRTPNAVEPVIDSFSAVSSLADAITM